MKNLRNHFIRYRNYLVASLQLPVYLLGFSSPHPPHTQFPMLTGKKGLKGFVIII